MILMILVMSRGVSREICMTYGVFLDFDLLCIDFSHHAEAKKWDIDR